jgi:hypothetical protein
MVALLAAIVDLDVEVPLSKNRKSVLALAHACDLAVSDPSGHNGRPARLAEISGQKDADDYIHKW